MTNLTLLAISVYFAMMLGIGIYAWRKSTADSSEYLLSGRSLGPAVTALAAGASDVSGWLMLGLPGALYVSGLAESWIAIGLFLGAWANWVLVAPRLRAQTEQYNDSLTIPDFLGNRFADTSHVLLIVASLVIVVFFAVSIASGLVAGGHLFAPPFAFSYHPGLGVAAQLFAI